MRNFAKIFLPTIAYAFALFLIISLANKYSDTASVSIFLLSTSIAAPVFLFFGAKANTLLATDAIPSFNFNNYVKARFSLGAISTIITLAVILAFAFQQLTFNTANLLLLIFSVCVFKIIEQQDELELAYYIKSSKYGKFGLIKTRRSLIIAIIFPAIFYEGNFIYAYFFTVFFLGSASLISILKIRRNYASVDYTNLRYGPIQLLKVGLPLSLSSSISSIASNVPKYIGYYLLLPSDFVLLGSVLYFSSIYTIFINSLAQYYLPKLKNNKHTNNERKIFSEAQLINFLIFIFLSLTSYFLGGHLLTLVYGSAYETYSWALVLLFCSLYFKGTVALYGTLANVHGKFGIQLKASILSAVAITILCILITPKYSLLGIFISIILSSFLELIYYRVMIFKKNDN